MLDGQAAPYAVVFTVGTMLLRIVFDSLILWFLSRRFSFEKDRYRYALLIAAITAVFSLLLPGALHRSVNLLLYLAGNLALIKFVYAERWGKSLIVGLLSWGIQFIVVFVTGIALSVFLPGVCLISH